MKVVTAPTSAAQAPGRASWRPRLALAASVVIGAGIPLTCFRPLIGVSEFLATSEHPWRVLLMPTVLLALAAVGFALFIPSDYPLRLPGALAGGGTLLVLAAVVSTAASQDPGASAVAAVLAVSTPVILVVALLHADVSPRALAFSFLGATAVFLLRGDLVFLKDWGLPTAGKLGAAKASNQPYDFHYYTLGNPDHTAGFLLMPLILAAFWAAHRNGLSRRVRALLWVIAAISLVTLLLVYVRVAILTAIVALAVLAVVSASKPWLRVALLSVVAASAAAFAALGWRYITLGIGGSGSERITSVRDGLEALSARPFTGVGLSQFGPATGIVPAHSSIVQAGAEMGVLGLLAILLIILALVGLAAQVVRRHGWLGLPSAAALAAAVYGVHAALVTSNEGLYSGLNPIWGLSAALLVVIALRAGARGPRGGSSNRLEYSCPPDGRAV